MVLSDTSVTRPVLASVLALLLVVFGVMSFQRLTLREYPNIDKPVVSIDVSYPGADASIVETRITQVIEERIAGVEGIRFIQSSSQDGRARISVEFALGRDIDAAANDIRDRLSRVAGNLPDEAEPPEVSKVDSSDDVVLWLNLASPNMTVPELSDYAKRYVVDAFSVLDGVARVRVGGEQEYAMRIWLDKSAMAARNITVRDVEQALRAENVDLPAGVLESSSRVFVGRLLVGFKTPADFADLVIAHGNGYLVRLRDIARVEKGTVDDRSLFRGNGVAMVGIGMIKQSTANVLDVARAAKAKAAEMNKAGLPDGMEIRESYDSSVFVEQAVREVYLTLAFALACVVAIMYVFLGSLRATLVPAITVPVSVIATFSVLYVFGFSVNLLTLLALVLGIGLVVDDAIVVLENIVRRIHDNRETPLVAAFEGTRQVAFAVIATTLVLVAVFVPLGFLQGDLGRLFGEFAMTMAAAVSLSSLVALTLTPMLASKVLTPKGMASNAVMQKVEVVLERLGQGYMRVLDWVLQSPKKVMLVFAGCLLGMVVFFNSLPSEYAPQEDRGAFFVMINGPEGASHAYMTDYMDVIEERLMPYVESGELTRLLVRSPRGFGAGSAFNTGMVIAVMNDWSQRRPAAVVMGEIRGNLAGLPGVMAAPVMRQAFGGGAGKPVQFVLGGPNFEKLVEWRDILVARLNEDNPGLTDIDWDYKETKPQMTVKVDNQRAADLGVRGVDIGLTLQTMLGGRRIGTYIEDGLEYDVMVEGERSTQRTMTDIANLYVAGREGVLHPLSNFVTVTEEAVPNSLNRFNRIRAITLEANLAEGLTLGEALQHLEGLARTHLPPELQVDYKGASRDFKQAGGDVAFVFILAMVVVFFVLAAQFESYVHPLVIMVTVPLALLGGLGGIWATGGSLNVYSQIGLVMLIGLAAKNGILIVEFANQLRDEGMAFAAAVREAARLRFRPIVMTSLTTVAGAIPLLMAFGAGSESRYVIGVVVFFGVLSATVLTVFMIPAAYMMLARNTGSPSDVARRLELERFAKPKGKT